MSLSPTGRRLVCGAALLLGTLAVAQAPAQADDLATPTLGLAPTSPSAALSGLTGSTTHLLGPIKDFRLDPLADSKADPLNNALALQPDHPGEQPLSTQPLTAPLSNGGGLTSVPLVGGLAGLLPG
jgi:hypothetical protein